jgi:hypothetical protein
MKLIVGPIRLTVTLQALPLRHLRPSLDFESSSNVLALSQHLMHTVSVRMARLTPLQDSAACANIVRCGTRGRKTTQMHGNYSQRWNEVIFALHAVVYNNLCVAACRLWKHRRFLNYNTIYCLSLQKTGKCPLRH